MPPYVSPAYLKAMGYITQADMEARLEAFAEVLGKAMADGVNNPRKKRLDALEADSARTLKEGGVWDAAKQYRPGDVVSAHNALFVCKNANSGQRPGTATAMWRMMQKADRDGGK